MFDNLTEQQAVERILSSVKEFYSVYRKSKKDFKPGDSIRIADRIYDENELVNVVDSGLEFWLTAGRFTSQFENKLKKYLGVNFCGLTNSGSSSNLVAFMALTSEVLGERAIRKNDEVITVAAAFPTTVSPIIQAGAIPVFVDIDIETLNIDVSILESALSPKTKAVFLAHTLGNPFNLNALRDFCDKNNLWLIEDNCDALGAEFQTPSGLKKTGSIGDIGTSSFYPAHHMTTGEGGAVYTNNPLLHKLMMSFRDWGRDCSCPGGVDNLCGARFEGQFGELPKGYDHKYVYSHFGYNLKMTDMQAAIGAAQIDKVNGFIQKRRENADYLYNLLKCAEDKFILPKSETGAISSWFGFPLTVRPGGSRAKIVAVLEENKIQTRNLFTGNIINHPCFDAMRKSGEGYRIIGKLTNTDRSLHDTFWVGVHPGLTRPMLDFMAEVILGAL